MGRRNGLNDDDLRVITDALGAQIEAEIKSDGNGQLPVVDTIAPLFRVKEKLAAMKGKTAPKLGRPRGSKSRVSAPEVEV